MFGFPRRATVTHTVPPADVVPMLDSTPAGLRLEHDARHKETLRLIHRTLLAESLKPARNTELVDLCLEVRSILLPSAPGSEVLREVPPVPLRYPVPVVPGGGR